MVIRITLLVIAMFIYDFIKNLLSLISCKKLIKLIKTNTNPKDLVKYRQRFLHLTYFVTERSFVKQTWNEDMPPVLTQTTVRKEFPFFDTINVAEDMLQEAYGFYYNNLFLVINPITWINKFITLPGQVIQYIGLDNKKVLPRALNILWQITLLVWWLVTPIAESYRETFLQWTKSLFE